MLDPALSGVLRAAPPSKFTVKTHFDGTTHVLAIIGEVDVATQSPLQEALDAAVAGPATKIVVDLGGCEFFCSIGLAALVELNRQLTADTNRDLLIFPGPRHVQRVFEITGLLEVLPFAEC
jgi:anti-anti-sigma factor